MTKHISKRNLALASVFSLCLIPASMENAFAAIDPPAKRHTRTGKTSVTSGKSSPDVQQKAGSHSHTPNAQTSPQGTSESIVVTGLSRALTAQRAPVSSTVFSSAAIRDAHIQGVSDFVALAPNVSLVQAQSAGISFMTIRGLTQVRNGQSPVAVIVDGVQQMDSRQFTSDLYDISQIEVLRGPQGDLWGRNAIGGAIIINHEQPTNKTKGNVTAEFGNGGDYRGKLAILGPIIKDRLFYDVTFTEHSFAGLLENAYLNKTADYSNEYNGRAHIKAVITDRLTADFRLGFDETQGGAGYYKYQSAKYLGNTCFLDPNDPFGGPTPNANTVSRTLCSNNRGWNTRDMRDASFRLNYDASFMTVTNVLSWLKLNEYTAGDQFPYTASRNVSGTDGTQTQWTTNTSWQDQLRFSSKSNGRFHWMFGGYFLDSRDYLSTTTGYDTGHGINRISTSPLYNSSTNPTLTYFGNSDHNQDFAVFGHLSYDILHNLTAEFGYRYDWNGLNQYIDPLSSSGVPTGCSATDGIACQRTRWFKQGQPKGTLTWRPMSNLTLFVDYGVGFRSGQFNQSGTAAAANLPGVYDIVKPERANTIEAGFKSQWFQHKLTLNGTFFNTKDRNSFYFLFVGSVGAQILVNIDKINLTGGELEAKYNIMPGLDVFANGGYTHSSITNFAYNRADQGNWAPYVPLFTANLGVQYRHSITKNFGGFGRFDVEVHGKQYWDPENSTARDSFNLYNLQIGLEGKNHKWSATFFVNNLLDTKYNSEFVSGGFAYPATPRTLGGQLVYNY
ncbi:TonB-dependent receptor [Acetobacter persici]|uniref:TonB-dependent receptor n=1 Tax=Acetobacter persici TaxID=1076596 RepID=UPI0020CE000B|nr:TonB-dependent receptor [Acetobacter persici]MCP9319567.1 TonB-dependent receptor [Acetobacter persici]